jgi:parvulin-like peptidyl-prolyl isomerase
MNKKSVYILSSVVAFVLVILVLIQQGLLPGEWTSRLSTEIGSSSMNSGGEDQSSTPPVSLDVSTPGQGETVTPLELNDIRLVLANVEANQRQALLENEATFREFVLQEASNKSLLAAARSNSLHENDNVRFLMQRAANNVLLELYINGIISSRVSPDFPSAFQIQEYYDNNREKMLIEERIAVSQVFYPVPETMTAEEISALEARAGQLAADIRSESIDFSTAALQNSGHEPSRLNGGNMGIIKVSELFPVIKEALTSLQRDEVSDPVRSQMGFHILKRGEIIPAQDVSLEQVQGDIRTLLINQARTNLNNDIRNLAAKSFPVTLADELILEWRSMLQSEN